MKSPQAICLLKLAVACSFLTISTVESFVLVQRNQLRAPTHLHSDKKDGSSSSVMEYDDFLPCPNPDLSAIDVVRLCMDTLMTKGNNEGLEVCFNFSSEFLQAPFQGQLEKFVLSAENPVFSSLVKCTSYNIVSIGNEIPGTNTRGAMQTCLMDVQSPGGERRFLWTMQKQRRPPRSGCWLIHECIYMEYAFAATE